MSYLIDSIPTEVLHAVATARKWPYFDRFEPMIREAILNSRDNCSSPLETLRKHYDEISSEELDDLED